MLSENTDKTVKSMTDRVLGRQKQLEVIWIDLNLCSNELKLFSPMVKSTDGTFFKQECASHIMISGCIKICVHLYFLSKI